jgi:hypothetical protein
LIRNSGAEVEERQITGKAAGDLLTFLDDDYC